MNDHFGDLHVPVLETEALAALALRPDGCYVDCTFGRGGHSGRILEQLGPQGHLFAIDRDPAAAQAAQRFADDSRFTFARARFSELAALAQQWEISGMTDGILLDLGVSSPQLDQGERGFTFMQDGPLDMRMDDSAGVTAAQWLAGVREEELARVLYEYGEERFARRIARGVVAAREAAPIDTTAKLVDIIGRAVPRKPRDIHFATRTFQAIRIAINEELDELQRVLPMALDILARGGRMVVISFHSLEDRIVKRFMRALARPPAGDDLPIMPVKFEPKLLLIGKAVRAGDEEMVRNRRARSAIMRVAEKCA
ncbi:MAG: 16S rRNA (cytosine(1402)-N(4))-methyltransferase RsmH [Gammaproteobacteria bacterium]|nr:16S rRNA (cytosine(1402)-N(4))-methyltransferase RsmH [Gammaproteobacteria bacterium]